MKLKKFASLLLAMVMVLALAVPAFATVTYSDKTAQSVTMKGATTVPKVQILLPSGAALTNSFLLNPYKVGYKVKIASDTESDVNATTAASGKQIISPILYIQNATLCKMQVDVTVTTTLNGNLKLMAEDYADDAARKADTKNNAYLYVMLEQNKAAAPTSSDTAITASDTNKIVLKAGDVKKTNFLQQNAAASDSAPNYIWIQFAGSMAEGPATPWTEKDTANVAFAFTFTPNQNAAPTSSS